MKFLRNPWVTGALAVIAVAVVVYQFMPQQRSGRSAPVSPAPPAVASAPDNSGSPATPALQHSTPPASASLGATGGPAEAPGPGMDRTQLESRFAGWVNAPQRDPFLLVSLGPQKTIVPTNSPVALWKLTGVWDQTGSRLAVVNNKVYGEGDEIQGFRIQKIEGDEVWFNTTNGLERIELKRHLSGVPTNAPPAK